MLRRQCDDPYTKNSASSSRLPTATANRVDAATLPFHRENRVRKAIVDWVSSRSMYVRRTCEIDACLLDDKPPLFNDRYSASGYAALVLLIL